MVMSLTRNTVNTTLRRNSLVITVTNGAMLSYANVTLIATAVRRLSVENMNHNTHQMITITSIKMSKFNAVNTYLRWLNSSMSIGSRIFSMGSQVL